MAAYARGVNFFIEDSPRPAAGGVRAAALRSAPVEHDGHRSGRASDVSHAVADLAAGDPESGAAGRRRQGQSRIPVSAARRRRGSAGVQCLGRFRRADGVRQAAAGGRSAPGVLASLHLVHGSSARAGIECDRRDAARSAGGRHRAQPADRLVADQPAFRCAGPLRRKVRSAVRAVRVPGTGGASRARTGTDSGGRPETRGAPDTGSPGTGRSI